jgi:2,5-dihydroxypyridine 5,6-dioxygenase
MSYYEISPLVYAMFKRQLLNCKLKSGETVSIVADLSSRKDYENAAFLAPKEIGADIFMITIPVSGRGVMEDFTISLGGMLRLPPAVVKALKGTDLVLDMTLEGFIHTPERVELQKSGVRILRVGAQPPQVLARVMAWSDEEAEHTKKRVVKQASKLGKAKVMKIVSDYGTNLEAELDPEATFASYGFSDEKGRWDVWGQNMVSNYPRNSNGTVVIAPGDYNVTPFAMYHQSKIELVIKDNYVVEINGDGFDAKLMREHLASYNDKNAYAVSHVGWGLNKKATWYNMATYDRAPDERGVSGDEGRVFWGNFLFSTGPNYHIGRFTKSHYDIALTEHSIYLDGQIVVDKGRVLDDN